MVAIYLPFPDLWITDTISRGEWSSRPGKQNPRGEKIGGRI